MAYIRKTRDYWDVEQCSSEGWECVTTEPTRKEALARLREYQANQPEYQLRLRKRREAIANPVQA